MKNILKRFLADESGAELTEYVVVLALIVLIIVATLGSDGTLSTAISDAITQISTSISTATSG